jgi:LacI family transcriptional regulator
MLSVKNVAELAGVSVGTVSRVINNHPSVKPETREKVLAAIEKLHYVPNEVARNFKMQKSMMVALLLPDIAHPFFSELTNYIEDELDTQNYKMILCNSKGKPQKEQYYYDVLSQNMVAGIIVITFNNVEHAIMKKIPVVAIDRHIAHEISCVTSDNYAGGRMAFNELIKAGVKRPAFLGYITNVYLNSAISEVHTRKDGFCDAAHAQGIQYACFEIPDDDQTLEASLEKIIISEALKLIDGIFINGDLFAARFIKQARAHQIRIPEDLKIIGYDGSRNLSWCPPYMSTIRQPIETIARTAVQLLVRSIEGETIKPDTYRLPVEYVQGDTT